VTPSLAKGLQSARRGHEAVTPVQPETGTS
jgi:hypothetical protein